MRTIQQKAYAKINVVLDVLGKTTDDMHIVDMVMTSLQLHDDLQFIELTEDRVIVQSETDMGAMEDNLIYKAAMLLKKEYNCSKGAQITVVKRIPMAAGLAGGSSDCAATLQALNDLWSLNISLDGLQVLAKKLGADVSYCLYHQTMRAEGVGEKLTKLAPFPKLQVMLFKPDFGISTKEAYGALKPECRLQKGIVEQVIEAILTHDKPSIYKNMENSFEYSTFQRFPELAKLKKQVQKIVPGVLLSGSGPTLYALYEEADEAKLESFAKTLTDYTIIQTETI